jgi:dipeptidyl aminopeptidase/acylaminoacyl peptidase
MKRLAYFAFLALLFLSSGRAEPPNKPKSQPERPPEKAAVAGDKWIVDDVINAETASNFRLSPDGRWAVWVKTTADKEKGERVAQLVRTDLAEKRDTELTRGSDSCISPRWSPDGKLLALLSARPLPKGKSDKDKDDEPKSQVWLMDPFGGEPWPLTEFSRGVAAFEWAGSDALVFVAQEETTLREKTLKDDKKDDAVIVEDEKHEPPARLFKVAVKSKKVTRLTDNADRIETVSVSPDGKYAVAIHGRSLRYTYDNKVKPAVFLHDLEKLTAKEIFADKKFNVREVRWARDSKGFYATSLRTDDPDFHEVSITELYHFDLAAGAPAAVDLGWDKGLTSQDENDYQAGVEVTPDGFLALLADGVRPRAARYVRNGTGWKREWLSGEHAANLFGFAVAANGKSLVYAHSSCSSPPQWYHAKLDGAKIASPAAIAEVNEVFKKRTLAKTEAVRWKGALGEEVEGLLYYPHGYEPGKKYPLVVIIHGGPFSADFDTWAETWHTAPNLLAQRGAFVLRPNYHGSSSYGMQFAASIANGKYYDLPVEDIEKGADALIAKGLVDRDKLGVQGWSNGAILTMALLTKSTRWKAAAAGAGGSEWVADWGACEFGHCFDRYYFGKSPLEDPQLYIKMAPFYQFDKVRTPTLLFQGDADRVVPPHHGWMQYRALQQLGKADVRLVMFPGAKHGLKKLAHQRRKLEEELAWFDRHLFKTAGEENEALKTDSPLARALKLQKVRREGTRYGMSMKGVLIPETVAHASLRIGRFEVTRAQYAEFDKEYKVEPGRENYPASGISFDKAKAYCAWLSQLTGEKYRLPNESEADELYDKSEGENTLDYWAGYSVNPEDAASLQKKIKELVGVAPLLREVGSFHAADDDGDVFDLGGNVAEWVEKKDGTGELRGGSADAPADVKLRVNSAAPDYRGFRVVKEK